MHSVPKDMRFWSNVERRLCENAGKMPRGREGEAMSEGAHRPRIVCLRDEPGLLDAAALWFSQKWGVPLEAYLDSMGACIEHAALTCKDGEPRAAKTPHGHAVPQWYVALDGGRIVAGCGVIENDFHDRGDLAPNLCAFYVDPEYRGCGLGRKVISFACEDMRAFGLSTLYLVTDHTELYEHLGWEYHASAYDTETGEELRVYRRSLSD